MSNLPTLLSSEELYRAKKFQVNKELFRLPTGEVHDRSTIRHPGAVAVLPIDHEGKAFLLRQYRYPLREELLEVCAGTLENGEDPLLCAGRELAEELFLRAEKLTPLGSFVTMPGFCNETMHAFAATGLSVEIGERDEGELISSVQGYTGAELNEMIISGELRDAKSVMTITLARLRGLL